MTGMSGVIRARFALTEPKMKTRVPVQEARHGMRFRQYPDGLFIPVESFIAISVAPRGGL